MSEVKITTLQVRKDLQKKVREAKPRIYTIPGFTEIILELGLKEYEKQQSNK